MQWLQVTVALFSLHLMSVVDGMTELETDADGVSSRRIESLAPAARKGGKRRR
jgi:hypothetical protein